MAESDCCIRPKRLCCRSAVIMSPCRRVAMNSGRAGQWGGQVARRRTLIRSPYLIQGEAESTASLPRRQKNGAQSNPPHRLGKGLGRAWWTGGAHENPERTPARFRSLWHARAVAVPPAAWSGCRGTVADLPLQTCRAVVPFKQANVLGVQDLISSCRVREECSRPLGLPEQSTESVPRWTCPDFQPSVVDVMLR